MNIILFVECFKFIFILLLIIIIRHLWFWFRISKIKMYFWLIRSFMIYIICVILIPMDCIYIIVIVVLSIVIVLIILHFKIIDNCINIIIFSMTINWFYISTIIKYHIILFEIVLFVEWWIKDIIICSIIFVIQIIKIFVFI